MHFRVVSSSSTQSPLGRSVSVRRTPTRATKAASKAAGGAEGLALARELRIPFISNQPQYSMLWRVIEQEVIPASQDAGMSQIVWSPMAQGILSGKYLPGQPPPAGSRATDELSGKNFIARWMNDDVLTKVQLLKPIAEQAGIRAMLTHPIDEEAARFYTRFGFIASPLREQQLLLLLKDARRWVR